MLSGCAAPTSALRSGGTPTPSPTPAPPTPTPTANLSGFQVAAENFTSADDGFVLGTVPCGSSTCLAMARTQDGGATWSSLTPPPTQFATGSGSGVSGVRFADQQDGWVFGDQLWATHDGGATWTQVSLPGLSTGGGAPYIQGLRASSGLVAATYYGTSGFVIASSPVGSDSWTASSTEVAYGAGPIPTAQLVLHDTGGWVLENDRVVVGGARLQGTTWSPWTPPCATVNGPAILAASSSTDLVALCDDGLWGGGTATETAYASSDAGSTFTQLTGTVPPACQQIGALSSPTSSLYLAGCGGDIEASFNGGTSWSTVYSSSGSVTYIGFPTTSLGFAVDAAPGSSLGSLLTTTNGGQSWTQVNL